MHSCARTFGAMGARPLRKQFRDRSAGHAALQARRSRAMRTGPSTVMVTAAAGDEITVQWHNQQQIRYTEDNFNKIVEDAAAARQHYERIVDIAELRDGLRVLDVGCGSGELISALHSTSEVKDITAVDLSQKMVDLLRSKYPDPGPLGNDLGVRAVCGDGTDLPIYHGPFDAIFFNSSFEHMFLLRDALLKASLQLRQGGKIIISHPQTRAFVRLQVEQSPLSVVHELPDEATLNALIADLPLNIIDAADNSLGYCMVLQVPELYWLKWGTRFMAGEVVVGFGRGSSKMGVPTANINPAEIMEQIDGLPKGVYFGWAQLEGEGGPAHEMVMNIGQRPTFADGEGVSVEVHIMYDYSRDFHGERLRVVLVGYLRPELRFPSMTVLVDRIQTDIGLARSMLTNPLLQCYQEDGYFSL